ncbi:hypothetical protein PHLCEN_2v12004 [Hermanssonia centrifuga]|uniref:Uncharacterized protein n=1 Tax=Hermanssonia centrifuga TaxID=98765 RepID=A0A2R6NIB1_9APHY|nr:hypothetical protein PHLCEN_2v12004 [Hermanssonia centrifuga]
MLIPTSVVSQFGTFRVPKKVIEDPGSTLLDLYDWNEVHNAEFPLFRFYDGKHVKTISWSEAGKAIHRAAAFFESRVGANPEDPQPVVVLLATTGYSEINLTGVVMGCHALPMFHGLGILQIGTAASCGIVVSTFKPISPAIFPTPANVFEESKATASDMICCIPAFIELWAADSAKVEHMKTLKGLERDGWIPMSINTHVDGHNAFATKDLFVSHETKAGLWKIYGRADDQIILSTGEKPFTYTAKGTARRQVVIDDYAREIEALYNATTTGRSEVVAPSDWSDGQTLNFVREVVKTALRRDVEDEVDIFQYGCDSLQATWILNQITGAIRASNISDSINLPSTSVYQASSISQLSRLVVESIQNSTPSLQSRTRGIMTQQLHSLVVKYTQGFPQRPAILRDPAEVGDVVLATGTTGGLGCHILVQLLLDDAVKAVYAFNRPSGDLRRHEEIFRRNGLDVKWLRSPKLYLVEGTLTEPALGLDNPTYEKIRDTITHVIHNAWKVSFNQSVTSFEGLLWGVRALVDLCISSPHKQCPHFLFTSSMGVFRTPKTSDPMLEEPIDDVSIVVGIGYSESKWIAEGILSSASQKRGLPTTCVRVGQLCGGASGYWNEKEYFPALVKSSLYASCLPDVAGTVSWIPSNDAALALVQMRGSHEPILHLAHPRPVAWKTFLQRIAERMQVPLVSYDVWLGALERSKSQSQELELDLLRQNPALRLLEFFRKVERGGDREPLGAVRMDLTKAMREAPSIDLPELDSTWAERWIDGWQKAGYIPRTDGMGRTAIGNTSRL